jgi:ATP synthase F0 subunit b
MTCSPTRRGGRARRMAVVALVAAVLVFATVPAFATEAEAAHGEHPAQTFLGLPYEVYWTFNLIVFIGLLAYAAGPALVRFLEDKQREIAHELAEADRQRAEAAGMESRLAAQIAELRHEVDEVAARADREGAREREGILAEAARERVRVEERARAEIAQGLLQAKQQLTAHAARLAADLAEQRLTAGLTREDRKRLFRDNLARLESKQGSI